MHPRPVFAPVERRIYQSLFLAMFPDMPGCPPGGSRFDLAGTLEELVSVMPRAHQVGIRFLAYAVELLPLWLAAIPTRFSELPPPAGERLLARLMCYRSYHIRQFGMIVKGLACLAYFQAPGIRKALDLPPPVEPGGRALDPFTPPRPATW